VQTSRYVPPPYRLPGPEDEDYKIIPTGETWLDGEPIYKVTWPVQLLSQYSVDEVSHTSVDIAQHANGRLLYLLKYEASVVSGSSMLSCIPVHASLNTDNPILTALPPGVYVDVHGENSNIWLHATIHDEEEGPFAVTYQDRLVYVTCYFTWADPTKYQ
jgi:hypothetical protein